METPPKKTILSHLTVKEATRRQVISLPKTESIEKSVNHFIKYKVNALLTTDEKNRPAGVVSKTDIMSAYYAGLPIEIPLETIMNAPPLFCGPDDSLEAALDKMRDRGIYRLYVMSKTDKSVVLGILAYPDIVGLLYKYCHKCTYSHFAKKKLKKGDTPYRYLVKDVMTTKVKTARETDSLIQVMDSLSAYRFGAILIVNGDNVSTGVVSKTDLMLAYKHGIPATTQAGDIMSIPVRTCRQDDYLEEAIKEMIFSEVHRLFVRGSNERDITGVLSLSDAARIRSGSCRACVSSRIKVDDHN